VARIVAVAPDLLLGSKIEAMLEAAGHEVVLTSGLGGVPLTGADLVVADLDATAPQALAGAGVPVIGCYSHVDTETRAAAEAAGLDLVVPRSRLARELPDLVDGLLSGP
jgi:hypothetical protein